MNNELKNLEDYTRDELDQFLEQANEIIQGIEYRLEHNKKLKDYILRGCRRCYIESISFEYGEININGYESSGCSCCQDDTFSTTLDTSLLFDDELLDRRIKEYEAEKTAKAAAKKIESERKKEEFERAQLKKLQEKYDA